MPNAIHVVGVSRISKTNSSARVYVCPGKMGNIWSISQMCRNKLMSGMSEMSAINVIHVLAMCGMSEKNNPDAGVNVLGTSRTSQASVGCAQMSWGPAACWRGAE